MQPVSYRVVFLNGMHAMPSSMQFLQPVHRLKVRFAGVSHTGLLCLQVTARRDTGSRVAMT